MTILLQYAKKEYVNKDCIQGFCEDKGSATIFRTIFKAMQYLASQNVKSIKEYTFIENSIVTKVRHHETKTKTEINTHRRRRRTV